MEECVYRLENPRPFYCCPGMLVYTVGGKVVGRQLHPEYPSSYETLEINLEGNLIPFDELKDWDPEHPEDWVLVGAPARSH